MAKKKGAAPLKEQQPANAAEEQLWGMLKTLDDLGVSMVDSDWRSLSEAEHGAITDWAAKRRIGTNTILPQCLRRFATRELTEESDAMVSKRNEGRKVLMACLFRKPGFDKGEEGGEMTKVGFRVPDANLSGGTALELFGRTRVELAFSRKPMGEWSQGELSESNRPIITCETEIHSFGWNGGNWSFSCLVPGDVYSLEDAITDWKMQGAVRVEVLAKLDPAIEEPEEKKPRGRPKKEQSSSKTPSLPGVDSELSDAAIKNEYNVALTENLKIDLTVMQHAGGRWTSKWSGTLPAGFAEEPEESARHSSTDAALSSLGRCVDRLGDEEGPEIADLIEHVKGWIGHLTRGKTPAQIEAGQ